MTNKKISSVIAIILGIFIILSSIPYHAFAQAPREYMGKEIPEDIAQKLDNAENLITQANQNPTDENITQAINSFIIPEITLNYPLEFIGSYISDLKDNLLNSIGKLPETKRDKYYVIIIKKSFETNSFFREVYGKYLLIQHSNIRTNPELINLWDEIKNLDDVKDALGAVDNVYKGPIDDSMGGVTNDIKNQFNTTDKEADRDSRKQQYKLIDGKCYRVNYKYVNGQIVDNIETEVESIYCMLLDESNLDKMLDTNYDRNTEEAINDLYNQKKNESNITLQYSLNKQDDYSSYYDSGIRISLNNTITYSQAKDIMYQVALKSNGQFIEDNNKFMCLIENKLFILDKTNKEIPIKDFERMFEKFKKVEVKALDTKIGAVCSLADYIEIKRIRNVIFNNKKIVIENTPIIRDNIALFPINEFAKLLGASAQIENSTVIVTNNDNIIIFEEGKDKININGLNVSVKVAPKKSSKGILMGQIQSMVETLGFDMEWDSETASLIINKK